MIVRPNRRHRGGGAPSRLLRCSRRRCGRRRAVFEAGRRAAARCSVSFVSASVSHIHKCHARRRAENAIIITAAIFAISTAGPRLAGQPGLYI